MYTITDILDLHEWMVEHLEGSPLFQRLSEDELSVDPTVELVMNSSEEAQKVGKHLGDKYFAAFRRV